MASSLPSGLNRTLRMYMSCIPLPCARSLTIGRNQQHTLGSSVRTHQTFSPVVVSNICAVRLQPVARYRPSGEKWTEQTTLFKKIQKQQGCLCNQYSPLMNKRLNKVNVKRFFDFGVIQRNPVTPFFRRFYRNRLHHEIFIYRHHVNRR